jgi:hypothetical protein
MQAPSTKIDWLSIGQLILGGISCPMTFSLAILLVYLGVSGGLSKANSAMDATAMFMLAGLFAFIGILNIPSVVLTLRSLGGKKDEPAIKPNSFRMASLGLISLPVWLFVGQSITQTTLAAWLLPWINILALVIPIWWLVEFGRRQLPSGSPQRSWGLISVSLGVTPLITLLAELVVTIIVLLAVLMILSSDPLWMDKFNQLIIQFNQSRLDPRLVESFFLDLLTSPLVITVIFLTVGLLMPLMEELLKPLGLWALHKRNLTPAEGFSGGLICGAGFALIESATLIAQNGGGSDWGQMVLLRIGTSLLHMTASGFVGWGLASAWKQKKYGRTLFAFLAAIGIHGLWNSLALFVVLLPVITNSSTQTILLQISSGVGVFVMVGILVLLGAALALMNRRLYRETQTTPLEVTSPSSN